VEDEGGVDQREAETRRHERDEHRGYVAQYRSARYWGGALYRRVRGAELPVMKMVLDCWSVIASWLRPLVAPRRW